MKKLKKSKTAKKQKLVLGIDLGGTTVTILAVNTSGKIIGKTKIMTEAQKGPDDVIARIADAAKKMVSGLGLSMKDIWRAGMGTPGPLDSKKGEIYGPVNLKGWGTVKLKEKMTKALGVKTAVENDANCAVYGEKWIGAAKNADNVVGLTLGTGIGGGVIAGGRLIRGANYNAGEIGHISLNPEGRKCNCGAKGCFERYCSATGIAITAKEKIDSGKKTVLLDMAGGNAEKITSKMVFEAMEKGDALAKETWDDFIKYLGAGVANCVNFMNPSIIVISGGVINAGDKLFGPLIQAVRNQTFDATFYAVKIVAAKLGEEAGAIGAAGLAIHEADFYGL
jgi:glucokinase